MSAFVFDERGFGRDSKFVAWDQVQAIGPFDSGTRRVHGCGGTRIASVSGSSHSSVGSAGRRKRRQQHSNAWCAPGPKRRAVTTTSFTWRNA